LKNRLYNHAKSATAKSHAEDLLRLGYCEMKNAFNLKADTRFVIEDAIVVMRRSKSIKQFESLMNGYILFPGYEL